MMIQFEKIGRIFLPLVILMGMAAPLNGLAQEAISPADRALAEALFRDGRALMDAGKAADACPKLAESHRLDPKAGTILNLAVCQEQLGQVAQAWASYLEAARLAARSNQSAREQAAQKKAAELEAILSKLTIELGGELKEYSVFIDGKAHSAAIVGTPMPLDPGDHDVEVRAPGYLPFKSRVNIPKGPANTKVVVPVPLAAETPASSSSALPPPIPTVPPPPPSVSASASAPVHSVAGPPSEPAKAAGTGQSKDDSSDYNKILGVPVGAYVVGTAGLAGIVVGSIFGVQTFRWKAEGDKECDGFYCSQKGLDAHQAAETCATISTVSFGVGLAGVGAAIVWYWISKPSAPGKSNTSSLWVSPSVLKDSASLRMGGSF